MQEDSELLRRYADSRDERAFAELVQRHLNPVYASAYRRVGQDAHLAADVAQLVFISLAKQARWLTHHPALTAWLYTTTRNQAANLVRTERRRRVRETQVYLMQDETTDASDSLDWTRATPALDEAMDQLNERDRVAVLLRFIENQPFAKIGQALEVSEDAARMRVDRALGRLRTILARRGVVSTGALLGTVLAEQAATAAPVQLAQTLAASASAASLSGFPSTLTLIQLMTTTKTAATIAAAGVALLMLTATTYEVRANQQIDRAIQESSARRALRLSEIADLKKKTADASAELTKLRLAEGEAHAKNNSDLLNKHVTPAPNAHQNPALAGKEFLTRHPEVKAALVAFNNANIASKWQHFFNTLQLSPAEVLRMETLLSFGTGYSRESDAGGDYIQLTAAPDLSWKETQDEIKALLGPDRYNQYKQYRNSVSARELTTSVVSALTFTSDQLSSEQSEALVALISSNQKQAKRSGPSQVDWNTVLNGANSFLTPAQVNALKGTMTDDAYQQAWGQAISDAQSKSEGAQQ